MFWKKRKNAFHSWLALKKTTSTLVWTHSKRTNLTNESCNDFWCVYHLSLLHPAHSPAVWRRGDENNFVILTSALVSHRTIIMLTTWISTTMACRNDSGWLRELNRAKEDEGRAVLMDVLIVAHFQKLLRKLFFILHY